MLPRLTFEDAQLPKPQSTHFKMFLPLVFLIIFESLAKIKRTRVVGVVPNEEVSCQNVVIIDVLL